MRLGLALTTAEVEIEAEREIDAAEGVTEKNPSQKCILPASGGLTLNSCVTILLPAMAGLTY